MYENAVFDGQAEITMDDLEPFVEQCRDLNLQIQEQLGFTLNEDIAEKPTKQLGKFLKIIGLKLKNVGQRNQDGRRIYRYKIDPESLALMNKIKEDRRRPPADKPDNDNNEDFDLSYVSSFDVDDVIEGMGR
ncbi:hypothetical protein [Aquibium sp. ELW1220]|uniref:hypothetical protein n=1 Tax=Aquibium sp. ELW1220 TaxID=2976766 RepID=UPI0025B17BA9|nr:hypothetical protein [Aquibium sp. ELW1220]MDN2584352.1 hypothetical protein [Aquibium sp. ELW1220]